MMSHPDDVIRLPILKMGGGIIAVGQGPVVHG